MPGVNALELPKRLVKSNYASKATVGEEGSCAVARVENSELPCFDWHQMSLTKLALSEDLDRALALERDHSELKSIGGDEEKVRSVEAR